nr:hypothetical protein [Actinomycetota bacterium]
GLVHRAALERGVQDAVTRVEPAHRRTEALARGQPDRAADQPDADDGDVQTAVSSFPASCAARVTRSA